MSGAWLAPDWPAPARVRAAVSTRFGPGVSAPPFERFNLGARNGDDPAAVAANRAALAAALGLPRAPHWLRQVHGVDVAEVDAGAGGEPCADAAVTRRAGEPLAILTADCLPVLFCAADGGAAGAAHAGWRGLAAGVLEATVRALRVPGVELLAWLGPCIGAASYEVGEEVRAAFVDADAGAAAAFAPTRPGHWLCDLAQLARRRLHALDVRAVYGGGFDTRADARFYSWRRDGASSGRFASLVWLEPETPPR
ncbi:peptidoglycan editing factor PgeF [Fulvimonas soli]|uniref:Purine nucleoside phosphorylase n=1 Tax=Fulvimonas soli TaxID=155197 RepID=A0A316I5S6_9GAMM|nr:peptidoglycan editing factor PgeF [Fulvimonas soli]PWK88616.1 hypothetical protein C7456_105147 [Fulvimonas soli]TNY25264.1 multi-copper polyphenol oxidoreductase [Fulvimonas soli]